MTRPALDLRRCTAVVTGAASGIGRATALALARRGCALALVDRDADGLDEAMTRAEASGVRVSQHAFDVTDADAVAALPDAVVDAHGGVHVLVNCAGVALGGRFEELSMEEFRWLMEINLFAVVGFTKAFLPHLQRAEAAQIANVSSLFGIIAPAEQTAYVASKFAVRGFSESLRHELEGSSVGVTVVHPGGVRTNITRNARLAAAADPSATAQRSARFEKLFLTTPPEEVGEAIAEAIERRKPRLLAASKAKPAEILQRLFPVRYWQILRRDFDKI